jgi:3-hydroxyisobutyrate dehydrogenase
MEIRGKTIMTVGYIGLGNMGGAIVDRLLLQIPLQVYDLNKAAVRRKVKAGGTAAASPAALARKCDVIMMCLPTSAEVREVIYGKNGLAQGMKPGTLLIDMTTGNPVATREMAAALKKNKIDMIDAPVSGGVGGAKAGTLAIMVGAPKTLYRRAEKVLKIISPVLFHAGGVGAGQAVKIVNNAIGAGQRLITMECVALGVKAGLDPRTALDIVSKSTGNNNFVQRGFPNNVLKRGNLAANFSIGLMHKDLTLATELGRNLDCPMPLTHMVQEIHQQGVNRAGRDGDVNETIYIYEDLAGVRLAATREKRRKKKK